ncbi:hypothetical protein N7494_012464 [Penicillium frequentans]|uniref:Actin-related protein 8 n=1 Tax=Penicillium frequentans TaxID=3151616 RepID=A0AAD6GBM9_9EURO|nr:hypothetical protein N7494_012464 [Penicillium glabrum]
MVGKKSGKALRDEGLERTDNNMDLSSWPQVQAINQKNYYTDYLKRDDQYLAFRLQNEEARTKMTKSAKDRDRALAMAKTNETAEAEAEADGDANMEDAEEETPAETVGSKVIVIHIGSQNLRIGLSSDALPKTVPMVIARKAKTSESEDQEEPNPKRQKRDDGTFEEPEQLFGPDWSAHFNKMSAELKVHMRQNKRRMLPNSKEMVVNFNRRTVPETISEHNDPMRIEWTELSNPPPEYIVGQPALRVPDSSTPRYKLYWPFQNGCCNERDYASKRMLFLDISLILEDAIKTQLGLTSKKDWPQYSCVFVIPDLYEKSYVTQVLEMLMREFAFARCFPQVFDFHLRVAGQDTQKHTFKAFDEVHLAPMGFFEPSIFDNSQKLVGRRRLIGRSVDIYDGQSNDPISAAQTEILTALAPQRPKANGDSQSVPADVQATPSKPQHPSALGRVQEQEATPHSSAPGSPVPEATGTPQANSTPATAQASRAAVEYHDDVLPVYALDNAILTSIAHAARSDEKKMRDFIGGIMVVGGGTLTSGFHLFLEERLQTLRPGFAKEIMIGVPPRDLDPQVVVWKGASIFGKLSGTNDSWIGQLDVPDLVGGAWRHYGGWVLSYVSPSRSPSLLSDSPASTGHFQWRNPVVRSTTPSYAPDLALPGPSSSQVPPVIQDEDTETLPVDIDELWAFYAASNQIPDADGRIPTHPDVTPPRQVTEEERADYRLEDDETLALRTDASTQTNELKELELYWNSVNAQINEFNDFFNIENPASPTVYEEDEAEEDNLAIIIVVSILVPIPNETPEFESEEDSFTQSTRSSATPSANGEDRVFSSAETSSSASSSSSSEATSSSGSSHNSDSSSVESGSGFDNSESDDDEDEDDSTENHPGQTTSDSGYGPISPAFQNPGPSNPGPSHHTHPQILGKRRRGDSPDNHEMSSKMKEEQPSGSFHQDYIASLRYRNDLPPPDMPPKFLDIPHEGLSRFLTPGFASNLARREEPNIDVDAEGGMPIDMVGIPGLHLGDESAIMAPENPQPIDPADLSLLMPLDQLRNPAPKNTNVSFLRRTQHISVERNAPSGSGTTSVTTQSRPLKKPKVSVDDPKHVKKLVQKGFDVAYPESKYTGEDTESHIRGLPATKAEIDAWANPVHPDNPKLKAVGLFAVLPDLEGFTDPGGLVQFKFDKAPVSAVGGKRDKRMDVALLRPSAPEDRICEEHAQKVALHKANPEVYPDPGPIPWDYDLFLSEKSESVKKIGISMDPKNPNRDNEELFAHEGAEGHKFHRYDRVRTYATSAQTLNTDQKQRDIALTLFQPTEGETKQRAAYYYPILGKTRLKPERARTIAQAGLAPTASQVKEDQIDQMQVAVRDPDESEVYKRALHRANIDPEFAKTLGPPPEPPVAEGEEEVAEKAEDDEDTRMSDE